MARMDLKRLLFINGLNQVMAADLIGVRNPYVSNYISGRGYVPRDDWQKIHNWFHELRAKV